MLFDLPPGYPPPPAMGPPYVAPPVYQPVARPVLVAVAAALSELVLIVATNNQSVTDWVVRKLIRHGGSFWANVGLSTQAFRWRLNSNLADSLAADYARDAVLLVVTGLLVFAVVRGPVTAGRAFWSTWTAVVVAAQVGAVVSAFVVPSDKLPAGHSATQRLFGNNPYSTTAYLFVGALALGLLTAIVTAAVAVGTRHHIAPPPPLLGPGQGPHGGMPDGGVPGGGLPSGWLPEPHEPPPWTHAPSYAEPPPWTRESAETVAPPATAPTTALPRWGEDDTVVTGWTDDTAALPRWQAPDHAETAALPPLDEAGSAVVRIDEGDDPGDDEDLRERR